MSLPTFFSPAAAEARAGETLALGEEVASHAVRVRRLSSGEDLEIVDGEGNRARGTVSAASTTGLTVNVSEVTHCPPSRPSLVLVQALAKGDRDLQAIESATEIGVDEVVPWAAERSIADWPEKKKAKSALKWDNLLKAASLQARRARFPHLHELVRGTKIVSHLNAGDLVVVLHESATVRLSDILAERLGDSVGEGSSIPRIVLIVGPEGGISPAEISALEIAGATTALLGPTVLRSSSAGPAGLVLVQNFLGRW